MPGSVGNPVILDPFQTIIEVHWGEMQQPDGVPTYITSCAWVAFDVSAYSTGAGNSGDDFEYPPQPTGYGGAFVLSAGVDYAQNINPFLGSNFKYSIFDIYDQYGFYLGEVGPGEVSASLPTIPFSESYAAWTTYFDPRIDATAGGGTVDPLFPDYEAGPVMTRNRDSLDYSGGPEKFTLGLANPLLWAEAAPIGAGAYRLVRDLTIPSATYQGNTFTAIGVQMGLDTFGHGGARFRTLLKRTT